MKIILFYLLSFLPLIIYAQKPSAFKVGINLYTYEFIKINKTDVGYERVQQDIPNGISFGVSIAKEWNNKWGIKTGFDYSYQNEKTFGFPGADRIMNYDFYYYKIPLSIEFFHKMSPKLYFSFTQGLQFSFLKYFKGVHTNYDVITTITPSGRDIYSAIHPDWIGYWQEDNWKLHRRELLGIVGSVGIKNDLLPKLSYSASIRYEYDISSADRYPYFYWEEFEGNMISHNFRIGLALEMQYVITSKRKLKSSTDCSRF